MPSPPLRFSVIVPVRNRPKAIVQCVKSIYASDFPPTDYEVLVIDNGSTDQTAREAARAGARTVSVPLANKSEARNAGARVARGDWLVFTDSDCEVQADWLQALARRIDTIESDPGRARKVGGIAGAIDSAPGSEVIEDYIALRGWIDQEKFLQPGRRFSPPFAATANLAVRKSVFEEVGGFDPDLAGAGQDADWCWRAAEAGWELDWAPEAHVIHHHRATLGDALRQAHRYGVGNAALFAKHREKWNGTMWIDLRFAGWALRGLFAAPIHAFSGGSALDRRRGWYDFLTNGAQAVGRIRGAIQNRVLVI